MQAVRVHRVANGRDELGGDVEIGAYAGLADEHGDLPFLSFRAPFADALGRVRSRRGAAEERRGIIPMRGEHELLPCRLFQCSRGADRVLASRIEEDERVRGFFVDDGGHFAVEIREHGRSPGVWLGATLVWLVERLEADDAGAIGISSGHAGP